MSDRSRVIDGRKVLPIKARTAPVFGEDASVLEILSCGSGRLWSRLLAGSSTVSRRSVPGWGMSAGPLADTTSEVSEYFGGTLVYMLGVNLRYENLLG